MGGERRARMGGSGVQARPRQRRRGGGEGRASVREGFLDPICRAVTPPSILGAAAALTVGLWGAGAAGALTSEQQLYVEAWRAVDKAYVDKSFNGGSSWLRRKEAALKKEPMGSRPETYAAIRKLLETLDDPFTRLLEPERYEALLGGASGSVTGVGLEIAYGGLEEKELVVVAPAQGGPAQRAGLQPKDILRSIGGVSTLGMTTYEAADRLQGAAGSQVVVTYSSGGEDKNIALIREPIQLKAEEHSVCNPSGSSSKSSGDSDSDRASVGYLRLPAFRSTTVGAARRAFDDLSRDSAAKLVLDLRANSGGSFPAGVGMAKLLLPPQSIVVNIADTDGVRDTVEVDRATEVGNWAKEVPMVVLVDSGTASAAEVLSGSLKDNNRAVIVGDEATFGKGLVQTTVGLSDGSGLAITVARYLTPNGTDINKVGISPDRPGDLDRLPTEPAKFCEALTPQMAEQIFG